MNFRFDGLEIDQLVEGGAIAWTAECSGEAIIDRNGSWSAEWRITGIVLDCIANLKRAKGKITYDTVSVNLPETSPVYQRVAIELHRQHHDDIDRQWNVALRESRELRQEYV